MEIDSKELKKILGDYNKELREQIRGDIREDLREDFERHTGALIEHSDSKFDTVFDYAQSIDQKVDRLEEKGNKMEQRQEMMFDKIGEIAEDVTVIKETVQEHEQKFKRVEFKK